MITCFRGWSLFLKKICVILSRRFVAGQSDVSHGVFRLPEPSCADDTWREDSEQSTHKSASHKNTGIARTHLGTHWNTWRGMSTHTEERRYQYFHDFRFFSWELFATCNMGHVCTNTVLQGDSYKIPNALHREISTHHKETLEQHYNKTRCCLMHSNGNKL